MSATRSALPPSATNSGVMDVLAERSLRALQICDLLEALADELPRRSAAIWREVRAHSKMVLQRHLDFASDVVLPAVQRKETLAPDQRDFSDHMADECADLSLRVQDLDDLLADALSTDTCRIEPEALGFALRAHFEALRRHIGWETTVLWPMAARLLTPADLGDAQSPRNPAVTPVLL
jgi:hypothetical protein